MNTDLIRMIATYGIAVLVLIGSYALLTQPSQVGSESLVPFITGIVGIVLGFVFNRESTTSGARAQERAVAQGVAAGQGGTTVTADTVTTGGPTTVNDR